MDNLPPALPEDPSPSVPDDALPSDPDNLAAKPPEDPTPPVPERSGLAVASLILGLAGVALCFVGPLVGIPAVICGHKAKSDIKKSGGTLVGSGLATGGLVSGYVATFLIFIVAFIALVVYPQWEKARTTARKNSEQQTCISNLQAIQCAKEQWALTHNKSVTSYPREYDLYGPGKPLESPLRCPAGGLYTLNALRDSPRCNQHGTIRW